jgi:hypothetical protein
MTTPNVTGDGIREVARNLKVLAAMRARLIAQATAEGGLPPEVDSEYRTLTWVLAFSRSFLGRLPLGLDDGLFFNVGRQAARNRQRSRAPVATST